MQKMWLKQLIVIYLFIVLTWRINLHISASPSCSDGNGGSQRLQDGEKRGNDLSSKARAALKFIEQGPLKRIYDNEMADQVYLNKLKFFRATLKCYRSKQTGRDTGDYFFYIGAKIRYSNVKGTSIIHGDPPGTILDYAHLSILYESNGNIRLHKYLLHKKADAMIKPNEVDNIGERLS